LDKPHTVAIFLEAEITLAIDPDPEAVVGRATKLDRLFGQHAGDFSAISRGAPASLNCRR